MSQLNLPHGREGRHIASILQVRLRLPVGHLGHTPIACLDYPQPESRFLSFLRRVACKRNKTAEQTRCRLGYGLGSGRGIGLQEETRCLSILSF